MAYADTIVEAYDFEAERWVTLTEKPSVTFGAEACYMKVYIESGLGACLFIRCSMLYYLCMKGKLHTIGGVQSKQVDQYDLETNTWATHFPRQVWVLTKFEDCKSLLGEHHLLFLLCRSLCSPHAGQHSRLSSKT